MASASSDDFNEDSEELRVDPPSGAQGPWSQYLPGFSWLENRYVRFIFRRIFALVVITFGITLILFILTNIVPADPAVVALGDVASNDPAIVENFREKYGLNDPLPRRYVTYVGHMAQGDFGRSLRTGRPVGTELARAIPATIELAVIAIVITIVVGVALGVVAGMRRESLIDQAARVFSLAGLSMPVFYLALISYYVFFFKLGLAPSGGRLDPTSTPPPTVTGLYTVDSLIEGDFGLFLESLHHIMLPALVLAALGVAIVTRFARSGVLEVMESDYVTAARAKGLPERTVISRYVLRSALVPIITVLGWVFAGMLSGAVLTETIFAWPGLGRYAYLSAANLDVNGIVGVSLFVGLVYVFVNFMVDLLYGVIDPRITVE